MIKKLLILSFAIASSSTIVNSGGFTIFKPGTKYTVNYDCNKAKYLCENGSDQWCDILHQHCQNK